MFITLYLVQNLIKIRKERRYNVKESIHLLNVSKLNNDNGFVYLWEIDGAFEVEVETTQNNEKMTFSCINKALEKYSYIKAKLSANEME